MRNCASEVWSFGPSRNDVVKQRRYANTPKLFAARELRQKSRGIWMWVEPRNENASLTALENAGTPPTLGLSPTPLAPIGWCGEGVTVKSVSQCGVSTAVGMKKSMNEPVTTLPSSS